MEGLGERLHHLREKNNWSYDELANQIKVTNREIILWEEGTQRPTIDKMKELSNLYELTLEELLPNRILINQKMSSIVKDTEGGRGTLYLEDVTTQPFYPDPIIKNVRILEVKRGTMKIQVHEGNQRRSYLLSVDDVLGFLEEVN